MKIAYNPSDCNPLSESDVRRSNDIIFDLAGNNIYVKGVKFSGVEDLVTNNHPGWAPIIKDYKQDITNETFILTSDGNNAYWNTIPELFFDKYSISSDYDIGGYKISLSSTLNDNSNTLIPFMLGSTQENPGSPGLVPAPGKGILRYLDSSGKWSTPEDNKVLNTTTTSEIFYLTGSISNNSNTGTQVFNTNNYVDPSKGIYSNKSLVINADDDQEISGIKSFLNSPLIGSKNIIQWDNKGNYILTYDELSSWNKGIIVQNKDSSTKQLFGWEGNNTGASGAYLGIEVSSHAESQYRFTPNKMFINNKEVITEDNIDSFIEDNYVNIEGDVMTGPLSVKINNYGAVLTNSSNGGMLQLGNISNESSRQIGYITGYKESSLFSLEIKSEVLTAEGNIISGGSISTYGKDKVNNNVFGIVLGQGEITISGSTPGINFYYNGSTRPTSTITELQSGTLTINAISQIIGGSYFGEKGYYFDLNGNIKANDITVDNDLSVTGDTALGNCIISGNIDYQINTESNIDIGSVFVTKFTRNVESKIITKVSLEEFATNLTYYGIISESKQLNVTQDWMDTGISVLTIDGTYIVQIQDSSKRLYSGIMSWSNKSSSIGEEILLHRSGSYTTTIYLRTLGPSIQIAGSNNTSSTFTFKFKRIL